MRFFNLLNFQHVVLSLFPALIFIVIFGMALAFAHFRGRKAPEGRDTIYYSFPAGIKERHAAFPLVLLLIIAGTVMWAFFYILFTGLQGVKI